MKKLCLGLFFALTASLSAAEGSDWQISEVTGRDKAVAGYIYHSGAIGTQIKTKSEKVVTSLRLVCTSKISTQRPGDPLLVVFWNTMDGNLPQYLDIRTDKVPFNNGAPVRWEQEGSILMRSAYESKELIQSMKSSKTIYFNWTDSNGVRRTTLFNLRDFDLHLSEFNTLCKTEL